MNSKSSKAKQNIQRQLETKHNTRHTHIISKKLHTIDARNGIEHKLKAAQNTSQKLNTSHDKSYSKHKPGAQAITGEHGTHLVRQAMSSTYDVVR